jgi:hypothetical protein
MKRTLNLILSTLLVAQTFLPGIALGQDEEGTPRVRIVAGSLNVRSGPGTDFDIIDSVKRDQILPVIRRDVDWEQVRLPRGNTGWVAAAYVEPIAPAPVAPPPPPREPAASPAPPPKEAPAPTAGGGGSFLGGLLKWASLLGAVALGALAYNQRSQGNDAYDQYKSLALDGQLDDAEVKWNETGDHDDKAQLYGIAAGGLFGLFLLQQFVFRGGSGPSTAGIPQRPTSLAWDPADGGIRASAVLARF